MGCDPHLYPSRIYCGSGKALWQSSQYGNAAAAGTNKQKGVIDKVKTT